MDGALDRRRERAHTAKHVFATRIVEHFGLAPYFEYVFGSELDGTRVHKYDLLAWAIEQSGTDPARAVMPVGMDP